MNLFPLHENPLEAAKLNCDTHLNKILIEAAQMLCIPFHLQNIVAPYKPSHVNHPVSKWVRESRENFLWTLQHAYKLYSERYYRFTKGHKTGEVLDWIANNRSSLVFLKEGRTPFAIAISDDKLCRKDPEWDESNPVKCYQLLYKHDKKSIAKWTNRDIPEFMGG
jgi:hypothetical protein